MSERELVWLATQALERELIVEFGSFHGRSTFVLGEYTKGKVWAVDPWNGDYLYEKGDIAKQINTFVMPYFLNNLKDLIKEGKVIPVRSFSSTFTLPHKVDMVFIDGDHRYETVVKDIKKAYELIKEDGLICGHDWEHPEWPGIKQAVEEYIGPVEVEDTIWFRKF